MICEIVEFLYVCFINSEIKLKMERNTQFLVVENVVSKEEIMIQCMTTIQ